MAFQFGLFNFAHQLYQSLKKVVYKFLLFKDIYNNLNNFNHR